MKVIGIIGGVGWPSTLEYYRMINQQVHERRGGSHAAELMVYSFDYARIADLQQQQRWAEIREELMRVARHLEAAGAGLLLLACNTLHKVADEVRERIGIPLLDIAGTAAEEAERCGYKSVGLLGSAFVMEQDFYKRPFEARSIGVTIPGEDQRRELNRIIFKELGRGEFREDSRKAVVEMIEGLRGEGAQAVVLGCTELPLLVRPADTPVKLLDTTAIHVRAAVNAALEEFSATLAAPD